MAESSPGLDYEMVRAGQAHPNVYIRKGKERFPLLQQRSLGAVEAIQKAGGWEAKYAEALAYLEKRLAAEPSACSRAGSGRRGLRAERVLGEWTSRMGAEYSTGGRIMAQPVLIKDAIGRAIQSLLQALVPTAA